MAWPAAVAGIAAAGASFLGSQGGGKESGSETTTQQPAPMQAEQVWMWEDFVDKLYGAQKRNFDPEYYLYRYPDVLDYYNENIKPSDEEPSTRENMSEGAKVFAKQHWGEYGKKEGRRGNNPNETQFDPDFYLKNNPNIANQLGVNTNFITDEDRQAARRHWNTIGKEEGLAPGVQPYRDRLAQDIEYQKGVDLNYLDEKSGLLNSYLTNLTGNTQKWQSGTNDLINATSPVALASPVTVSLGDFSMPYTTGSQRHAQGTLNNLFNQTLANQNNLAETAFGAQGDFASESRGINRAYTPNMAENEYMNFLNQLVQRTEDRRYGIPTQTASATFNPNPDVATSVANSAQVGSDVYELFQTMFSKNNNQGG